MPLYEYECRACGQRVEAMQSFSEPPLTACERCGGELKKLLSAPAVQFKGSGWYVSDYGRVTSPSEKADKAEKVEKAEGETKAGGEAKSEGAKKDDAKASTSGAAPPAPATPSAGGSES